MGDAVKLERTSRGIDMTQGGAMKALLRFSAPLLAGNALQQVYNMVDSSVAGRFIGMNALSAVSNGYMIVMMITALFSGLSVGGTVIVAQYFGRKNEDGIRRAVDAIYWGISVIFFPLMIAGYFAARPLLSLFNIPPDILPDAVIYVQVIFLGVLGGMGYNVNAGILQGLGDSHTSLKYLTISCVGNLVLDVIFVAGFRLGVFGTALATIIAQFASWLLSVRYINRTYPYIHIGLPRRGRADFFLIGQALKVGVPSSIAGLQYTVGMMLIQTLINGFGADFIAGVNAGSKIDAFAFLALNSFSAAMSTYAAQNVGAGKLDRVGRGIKAGAALNCVVCIGLALIFVPLGRPIMEALFGLTPAALDAGMAYLYRVMIPTFILGISYTIGGALNGAGAALFTTMSGIIALWVIRVPLAWWMAAHLGRDNMFIAYPVAWCASITMNGLYYLSGHWKNLNLLRNDKEDRNESDAE